MTINSYFIHVQNQINELQLKIKYSNTAKKNSNTFFTLTTVCIKKDGQCHHSQCSQCSRFHYFSFSTSRPAQLQSSRSQSGYNSMWNQRTEKEDRSLERRGHAEKNEALHVEKEINWARDMPTLIFTVGTCLHYFSPCLVDSIHTVHHPIR